MRKIVCEQNRNALNGCVFLCWQLTHKHFRSNVLLFLCVLVRSTHPLPSFAPFVRWVFFGFYCGIDFIVIAQPIHLYTCRCTFNRNIFAFWLSGVSKYVHHSYLVVWFTSKSKGYRRKGKMKERHNIAKNLNLCKTLFLILVLILRQFLCSKMIFHFFLLFQNWWD